MNTGPSPKPSAWFTGRTRLVTVVSIGVVVLAGAAAVSANVGILGAASDDVVGDAAVTGDLGAPATPAPQVVDVYLPDAPPAVPATTPIETAGDTPTAAGPTVQQFAVDVAGTVAVAATDTGLRLDQVVPAAGWSWTLAQSDPTALLVTMTDGVRTLEFRAALTPEGTISASVDEPILTAAPAAPAAPGAWGDDEDDDDHDDHEDEDHDEEYEGGEDDD